MQQPSAHVICRCPTPLGCRGLSPRSGTSRGGGSFGGGLEIGDGGGGKGSGPGCAMGQPPPMQCRSPNTPMQCPSDASEGAALTSNKNPIPGSNI